MTIKEIMQELHLQPLPNEGGFFTETYRATELIPKESVPARYKAEKAFSTAIYYFLTSDTFSALHRLPTDEIYHFYLGDPVEMLNLSPDGGGEIRILGTDLSAGMRPQVVVPRGTWQGSRLQEGGAFALLGTTVAPAFEFADFELGDKTTLASQYPEFSELIAKLTR